MCVPVLERPCNQSVTPINSLNYIFVAFASAVTTIGIEDEITLPSDSIMID